MLLIRVDGGREVGLGHLMRCLELCRALELRAVETVLLSRERGELKSVLSREKRMVVALPHDCPEVEAAAFVADIRNTLGGDAVLIDLPDDLSQEEYEAYAALGRPLIVLDDQGPAAQKADLAINAIAHPDHLGDPPRGDGLHRGAQFIALDKAFRDAEPAAAGETVRKLLVAMGGSDPHGITERTLEALSALPQEIELHALLGPAFKDQDSLRERIEKSGRPVELHQSVDGLPQFLAGFDLAVLSFGITAYGAACLGLPAVHIAHNQGGADAAYAFSRLYGCSVALGKHDEVEPETLVEVVEGLIADPATRAEMSRKGREAVDGKGLERVTDLVFQLLR